MDSSISALFVSIFNPIKVTKLQTSIIQVTEMHHSRHSQFMLTIHYSTGIWFFDDGVVKPNPRRSPKRRIGFCRNRSRDHFESGSYPGFTPAAQRWGGPSRGHGTSQYLNPN